MHDTLRYMTQRSDPPQLPPQRSDLRPALRLSREFHPAAVARRGGARQGLAARQDAGRPLAALRQSARLLRLHVDASRQEAALHGRRVRAGARMEPRHAASTGTCSPIRMHRGVQRLVRDLNRLYRELPALHAARRRARRLRVDRRRRRRAERAVLSAARRAIRTTLAVVVCNFTPVPRHGYRIGVPRGGRYREMSQHRRAASTAAAASAMPAASQPQADADARPSRIRCALTLPPLAALIFAPEPDGG